MKNKARILIVDDNPALREVLSLSLSEFGYDVVEASSGKEALNIIKTQQINLVTLDLEMPEMDGNQVCVEIRNGEEKRGSGEHLPIIILSSHDNIDDREKAFTSGATSFVAKTNNFAELNIKIKSILEPNAKFSELGVLIIEDSVIMRKSIASSIRELNVKTYQAKDGIEAIDFFQSNPGKIDLIITDLEMPRLNGEELCLKFRNELHFYNLPIMVITGSEDKQKCIDLFKAGASDYILKPIIKEELLAKVLIHLDKLLITRELENKIFELQNATMVKDKFLAICTHDLRSPLNGILGFSEILLEDQTLSDENKDYVKHILSSGNDLLNLIEDLLILSMGKAHLSEMQMEKLIVVNVLTAVLAQQKIVAAKKQIKLKFNFSNENQLINGNPLAIKRIFTNLITNAIKFTPRGGEILCNVSVTPTKNIEITIKDSGIGMSADQVKNLFTKNKVINRPGTDGEHSIGIGLHILKDLIDKNHGTINATSTEGIGTEITLSFPIAN